MILFILPFLNVAGGRGYFSGARALCRMVLMPSAVGLYAWDWQVAILAFAGFALWAIPGWGKYFAAGHGQYDPQEKEIGWIDWMGEKIFPYDGKEQTNRKRGIICMGMRGLFLWPFFAAIGHPLTGLAMFMQGFCYGAGRWNPNQTVPMGEFLTGVLIGILVYLCVR